MQRRKLIDTVLAAVRERKLIAYLTTASRWRHTLAPITELKHPQQPARLCAAAMAIALTACGGGGGGGGDGGRDESATVPNSIGIAPSSQSAQQCSAANPFAPAASKTGSLTVEKNWLRSYFDEAYLWYNEVPSVDATAPDYSGSDVYVAMDHYFKALKTTALTESGSPKDRFGFTYPTSQWNELTQSGVASGYGFEVVVGSPVVNTQTPNRNIRIAYIEPGTEAAALGLQRGDTLVAVDGISADDNTEAGIDALSKALLPSTTGATHTWNFSRAGTAMPPVTLTSANITKTPVLTRRVITAADGKKVGYMVFNDHIATAEGQLVEAVNYFKAQAIDDLVLDIRYNGGGYVYIASELAYMIAGQSHTQGKLFEQFIFNDKRSAESSSDEAKSPFYNTSTINAALPSLDLARVFVLAQSHTCSASEAIINGLRGADVDVRLIGGTTCGKPYGYTAKDNCGISYFPIEFKGANAKGFGDYADGFVPGGSGTTAVPGCTVSDDLGRQLGDPIEAMLATALDYRISGVCPVPNTREQPQSAGTGDPQSGVMLRGPARENRILRPR